MVLQTCLEHVHFGRTDLKNVQLEPVLLSIFKFVLDGPNFTTVLCQSLRSSEINEEFLENFSNVLHLSLPEKIGVSFALSDSENIETRMVGEYYFLSSWIVACMNSCISLLSWAFMVSHMLLNNFSPISSKEILHCSD